MNIMCGGYEGRLHEEYGHRFSQLQEFGHSPAESQTGSIRGTVGGLGERNRVCVSLKRANKVPCLPLVPLCNTVPLQTTNTLPPPAHFLNGRNSYALHFFFYLFCPPSVYCFRVVSGGCRRIQVTDGRRRKCDFSTPAGWTCSG